MRNRLYILIIFALQTGWLQAQPRQSDTLNRTDQSGKKQGYWIRYDHDTLRYEGRFIDDKPTGEFKYYYGEGQLKARVDYLDEHRSRATLFHTNGIKMAEGDYWDTAKDGVWKYYDEQGVLVSDETYDKSVRTGIWRSYYPEGQTVEEFTYRNDMKDGPWKQYFPDGSLKLSGGYAHDKKNGPFQLFYPGGQILLSGSYKNDDREGDWLYYLEDGTLQKKRSYRNGYLVNEIKYIESEDEKE